MLNAQPRAAREPVFELPSRDAPIGGCSVWLGGILNVLYSDFD
jgi:hypothetical protein